MTPNFKLSTGSYKVFKFPSGEVQVTLSPKFLNKNYIFEAMPMTITGSILSSDNLIELLQLNNALNSVGLSSNLIHLVMPYCAYSRQDRICNEGESFSLKLFAQLINSCNFTSVTTWDNHSDVSTALINNCINVHSKHFISKIKHTYDYFISPDAGSNKKVFTCSQTFNTPMIRADKTRDVTTGKITDTQIFATADQLANKTVLIVDDICQGGRTFIQLAETIKALQPSCTIHLYVTHGFFDIGLSYLSTHIDHIYTTSSVCKLSPPSYDGLLTII